MLAAQKKIREQSEQDADFQIAEKRRQAEEAGEAEREERAKRFTDNEERMSLTSMPIRTASRSGGEQGASVFGTEDWMEQRLGGDRYLARIQAAGGDCHAELGGLDTRFKFVNGVIVQEGDEDVEDA